tara:strand:- start:8 stop:508 length:501 start_codon:yes stop_codon:yes gene_type:complete
MWIIIKHKKKELNSLKRDISNKIGRDVKFYTPMLNLNFFDKKKIVNLNKPLLGDYIFCHHSNFKKINFQNLIIYSRGLKYILKDYLTSQNEINAFIERCVSFENKNGFITQDFFDFKNNKKFKFFSGPFTNFVFDLVKRENNNNLKCLIKDFKLTITGKQNLFLPV